MNEPFFTSTHLEIIGTILMPLGSGLAYLIWRTGQNQLKLDLMWEWFTNHGHETTGYQPGDELRGTRRSGKI